MDPKKRILLRIEVPDRLKESCRAEVRRTANLVESLMGRRPELRLKFVQENAKLVRDLDV